MPSELIGRIRFKLADKIRNPARRRKMFARMAQDEIAMEVRALREKRGFRTQAAFAKHVHMQQSAVSRIENAEYQGWTFKTLLRVAHALDARLRVSFEPAEDFQRRFDESERTAEIEGADSAANAALLIEATTTTHGLIIRKHQEDPRWQSLGTDLEPMASIVVDENPHALTAGAIDILRGNQWQRDPH